MLVHIGLQYPMAILKMSQRSIALGLIRKHMENHPGKRDLVMY